MKKILFFCTIWCKKCKNIEILLEQYSHVLSLEKINVTKDFTTTAKYKIIEVPTIIIFLNDEQVEKLSGEDIEKQFSDLMKELKWQ